MRVLFHPKVGAVFINRYPKGAPCLRSKLRGGRSNWRAWWFGRWRLCVVKATPHWISN